MGPMGPRGLGPWALWAPGALGPNYKNLEEFQNLPKDAPKDLSRPLGHIPDGPKELYNLVIFLENFGSEPCARPLGYGR